MPRRAPVFTQESVRRFWLDRQGLSRPRGDRPLNRSTLRALLESVGALQIDSVNVLDRAHYLTLWSRFGLFERETFDGWVHGGGVAYEYWGHEASILPISHLPLGLRRMRRFPPESWRKSAWWERAATSTASKRRVLRRIRAEGPLESVDFERRPEEKKGKGIWSAEMPKEDKRSLSLLWHAGRLAIHSRRHFRRVYDLAERIYPAVEPSSGTAFEDSWLEIGLRAQGIASERHLDNYITAPRLKAPERRRVIARALKRGTIVEVEVDGLSGPFYVLSEDVDRVHRARPSSGTTLLCPFDSLLWQRQRAKDLFDFSYRLEIYVPAQKRDFGYYAMPILHEGALVGRIDPKNHRESGLLEILKIELEPGIGLDGPLAEGLRESFEDLARFVQARNIRLPRTWSRKLEL